MNKTLEQSDIVRFFHCGQCLQEIPDGQTPRAWADISVGLTNDYQVQVWCNRHEMEICIVEATLQFSGRRT